MGKAGKIGNHIEERTLDLTKHVERLEDKISELMASFKIRLN
jgi:hypothetical protein